jgi:pimeloyl-ACP methyl ester carboxylesterase
MQLHSQVHLTRWGAGPQVVLIHGGTPGGGAEAFASQKPLADHWSLVLPDRPGHGQTVPQGREDFERDADLLAPLLTGGAHLVGHSYGGLVALYMAAHQPQSVRSLTLIEPPAYWLAQGDPVVDDMSRANRELFENPPPNPVEFVRSFFALVGIDLQIPESAPAEPFRPIAEGIANIRGPQDAKLEASELASGGYPIQVLTSGRIPGFEGIAAALVAKTGATHLVVRGTDHAVQTSGEQVNPLLARFWSDADAAS